MLESLFCSNRPDYIDIWQYSAWLCCYVCRQKEALKNATEAFQEEKKAHIELYQKQQQVRTDLLRIQNITMKVQHSKFLWFRKFGSRYPMFSEDLAGHCRCFPKIKLVTSSAKIELGYIRWLHQFSFLFPMGPFNSTRSYENLAMDRSLWEPQVRPDYWPVKRIFLLILS